MNKLFYALLALFVLAVGPAFAAIADVTGVVTMQDDSPVDGALVSVTCTHESVDTTEQDTTDSDGTYLVVFNADDCSYGDALLASATKDDLSGSNTGNMCDEEDCFMPIGLVDITIPEFTVVGALMAALAVAGMLFYRRK